MVRYSHYLHKIIIKTKRLQYSYRFSLAFSYSPNNWPHNTEQYKKDNDSNNHVVTPVHLWFIGVRVVDIQVDKRDKGGIGCILESLVQLLFYFFGVFIAGYLFRTVQWCTQADVLYPSCYSVYDRDGEVLIWIFVVEAVIIVSEVIEKFAWIGIGDSR